MIRLVYLISSLIGHMVEIQDGSVSIRRNKAITNFKQKNKNLDF